MPLANRTVRPNHVLKGAVEKFMEGRGEARREQRVMLDIKKAVELREADIVLAAEKLMSGERHVKELKERLAKAAEELRMRYALFASTVQLLTRS